MEQKLIQQYKENDREIEKINNNLDELREQNRKKTYNLQYKIYWDKIKELEKERDEKIEELNGDFEEKEKEKTKEKEEKEVVIFNVQRILKFLEINKKIRNLNFKAYSYNGYPRDKNYLKPIDTIADDEFKKIQVFIYGNDKPKNKFSLCVVGMTIFNEDILKSIPKSYLQINKENGYFNIEEWIKDLPTDTELKTYYEKNKDKILKEFLEEHKEVEEKYLDILKNYKLEDFKELFDVWCDCGFFLLNRNSYSLDCNDDDKSICPKCKKVLR